MRRLIAITGTPGTGKTKIFGELEKSQKGVMFLDTQKIIEHHKLYAGKDKFGSKIVNIYRLSKLINKIASEHTNKTIVIESHLLCELKLKDATAIVLREHLGTLKRRLTARKYPLEKIRDNIICEATDYCGIKASRNYPSVYEFLSSDKKTPSRIKEIIKGRNPNKVYIELGEELREIIKKDIRYAI